MRKADRLTPAPHPEAVAEAQEGAAAVRAALAALARLRTAALRRWLADDPASLSLWEFACRNSGELNCTHAPVRLEPKDYALPTGGDPIC